MKKIQLCKADINTTSHNYNNNTNNKINSNNTKFQQDFISKYLYI